MHALHVLPSRDKLLTRRKVPQEHLASSLTAVTDALFKKGLARYIFCRCLRSIFCPRKIIPFSWRYTFSKILEDGWPESEKDVFQAALRMVVVKDSRWIVGEFYMSYGKIWCEKVRLIKKRIFGKGHQMTCVLQPQRERGGRDKERERKREREKEKEKARERERMKGGGRKKT